MTLARARRIAPTAVAAGFALVYVIVSPPSLDLAAHLLRAKLFDAEGFGLWNNWWYAGHNVPGYSVLFPPLAAALTPQLVAAIAAVAAVPLFDELAGGGLASLWFAVALASNLYGGRLTFTAGVLPATATVLALARGRGGLAAAAAVATALVSPVAALFVALAGAAKAIADWWRWRGPSSLLPGAGTLAGALVPVALLAIAFPEGGTQPFAASSLWPALAIVAIAWLALRDQPAAVRIGLVLYAAGLIAAYAVPTPVGSNAARLAPLLAGSVAALGWRPLLVAVAALPILFVQWEVPVRDLIRAASDPSIGAGYYAPLLRFLAREAGLHDPPFRVEIPPTRFHYETYEVAPHHILARGWERQLDVKYNGLFYGSEPLSAASYAAWLRGLAVRFVAVADAPPDYSAVAEERLIAGGLPYLREVFATPHWRVYAVADPTPIVTGAATLNAIGPNGLALTVHRAGNALVRARFTPYWSLSGVPGCVVRAGDFTGLVLRAPGAARLEVRFALNRIGTSLQRCN
jgi:hypothetical protein